MSGVDFAARALALSARADTAAASPRLFVERSGQVVPSDVACLFTSGFAKIGIGAGQYVHDGQADGALLAAHPKFSFAAADGRVFSLLPEDGSISVELGGATAAAGVND